MQLLKTAESSVQNNLPKASIHVYFAEDDSWARVKPEDQIKPLQIPSGEAKTYPPFGKYMVISKRPNTKPLFGARTSLDNPDAYKGCIYTVKRENGHIAMESTPANACPILFAPITRSISPIPAPPATSRTLVIDPSEQGQGHQDIYSSAPAN